MDDILNYKDVLSQKRQVIIYGATIGAKLIFQTLQKLGVEVLFFCDKRKHGTSFCGLNVLPPNSINDYPEAVVIIALTRSFDSALHTLKKLKTKNIICEASQLLEGKIANDFKVNEDEAIEVENFLKKYALYTIGQNNTQVIPSLEAFITEKCTLKCKYCSHLLSEYSSPKHHSLDLISTALDTLFTTVTTVKEFFILGGEPLLHPQLPSFLRWCAGKDQIETITILSNGTILPNEETIDAMQETGCRIRVSNYGSLSRKKEKIEKICNKLSIPFHLISEDWVDLGRGEYHNYSSEKQKQIFESCPFSFELLLLEGKMFRCAHGAHMYNSGIISEFEKDYLDLLGTSEHGYSFEERLRNFFNIKYLNACSYCNGISSNFLTGPPEQLKNIKE